MSGDGEVLSFNETKMNNQEYYNLFILFVVSLILLLCSIFFCCCMFIMRIHMKRSQPITTSNIIYKPTSNKEKVYSNTKSKSKSKSKSNDNNRGNNFRKSIASTISELAVERLSDNIYDDCKIIDYNNLNMNSFCDDNNKFDSFNTDITVTHTNNDNINAINDDYIEYIANKEYLYNEWIKEQQKQYILKNRILNINNNNHNNNNLSNTSILSPSSTAITASTKNILINNNNDIKTPNKSKNTKISISQSISPTISQPITPSKLPQSQSNDFTITMPTNPYIKKSLYELDIDRKKIINRNNIVLNDEYKEYIPHSTSISDYIGTHIYILIYIYIY